MAALRIGFLGLGQMGQPMVRNLLRAGFSVTGFDLSETAMATLSQEAGFMPPPVFRPQPLRRMC